MIDNKNGHTHTAYAYKRIGKKSGRMLECGSGRIDPDRSTAAIFLDRLPVGGFSGYVLLLPHGVPPDQPQPSPIRPDGSGEEEEF